MLEDLPEAVGETLGDIRAGLTRTLYHAVDLRHGMAAISLGSLAFADHAPLPEKYSADGPGLSPPLQWHGVPTAASEVVLMGERCYPRFMDGLRIGMSGMRIAAPQLP